MDYFSYKKASLRFRRPLLTPSSRMGYFYDVFFWGFKISITIQEMF